MTVEPAVEAEPSSQDAAPPPQQAHVETERTFDVARRSTVPRLDGVAGIASVQTSRPFAQTATYLDTIELDLLRAKHTLRRRVGGHDAGWHLKTPREDGSRLELAEPLGTSAMRMPAAFLAQLSDIVASKALVRVATVRTRRTERRMLDESGRELAVMADDTVEATVYLFGERIYRWREVEVELVEGDAGLLEEVTGFLLRHGLSVSASQSKLGRALADARRRLDNPPPLRAGDVVLGYLAAQVGVLQWTEARVRADRPDAVHKARVATRRLRSALRTFRPLLDRTVSDPLRREIRWLTGVLGAPRDAEVLLARFEKAAGQLEPELVVGASVQRLEDHLRSEHLRGHARLVAVLDGPRYGRLMASLAELLVEPPWLGRADEPARDVIPRLVRKSSKAVERAVETAQQASDPAERDEALHEVRKRIKAARYAAEAAADVVRDADERADAWSRLQDTLGEYQDSVVAREVIAKVSQRARRAKEDTFTFGVLGEREAASARSIIGEADSVLQAARAEARRPVKARHAKG